MAKFSFPTPSFLQVESDPVPCSFPSPPALDSLLSPPPFFPGRPDIHFSPTNFHPHWCRLSHFSFFSRDLAPPALLPFFGLGRLVGGVLRGVYARPVLSALPLSSSYNVLLVVGVPLVFCRLVRVVPLLVSFSFPVLLCPCGRLLHLLVADVRPGLFPSVLFLLVFRASFLRAPPLVIDNLFVLPLYVSFFRRHSSVSLFCLIGFLLFPRPDTAFLLALPSLMRIRRSVLSRSWSVPLRLSPFRHRSSSCVVFVLPIRSTFTPVFSFGLRVAFCMLISRMGIHRYCQVGGRILFAGPSPGRPFFRGGHVLWQSFSSVS